MIRVRLSMADLQDRHRDADIYVIGSGASLDYYDRGFFDDKVTVGCNEVSLRWRETTYTVTKYHDCAVRVAERYEDLTVVTPRYLHGNHAHDPIGRMPDNVVIFDHPTNRGEDFDAERDWPEHVHDLVVSWSTITTAMHFAAYLGAANIVVVGHDCGPVGGRLHVRDYPLPGDPDGWLPIPDEATWLRRIASDSIAVKQKLEDSYAVRVVSLSPFVNPLEAP